MMRYRRFGAGLATDKGITRHVDNPNKEGPEIPGLRPEPWRTLNRLLSVSFSYRRVLLSWPVFSRLFSLRPCPIFSSPIFRQSFCFYQPKIFSPDPFDR